MSYSLQSKLYAIPCYTIRFSLKEKLYVANRFSLKEKLCHVISLSLDIHKGTISRSQVKAAPPPVIRCSCSPHYVRRLWRQLHYFLPAPNSTLV